MSSAIDRFRSYDFEADNKWQDYLIKLTFPPGREDLVLKKKVQWYKREIDPSFDIDTVVSSTYQAPAADVPKPEVRHQSTASPAPSPSPPAAARPTIQTPTLGDAALFLGHIMFIFNIVLALQPFNRFTAHIGFTNACRASIGVHGYRLVKRVGAPSFATLRPWMQRASTTTEFFYLISTLLALNNPSAKFTLVAAAILAVFHVSAFLNSTIGHTQLWKRTGAGVHQWLSANRDRALYANALLEVFTVFQLAFSTLQVGPKALMSTYMFLNQLRGRRWNPETKFYHAAAWAEVGRYAEPVLRAVPPLQRGVGVAQRWWFNNQPTANHTE